MSKNYYDILGISKDASQDQIKKAFRKLAHQYHPDKSGGDEQKFKEINEAYQVLGNQEKRQQYDQFGQTFEQAQAGGGFSGFNGFRDFSGFADAFRQGQGGRVNFDFDDLGDIVGDMFGFGSSRSRRAQRQARGRDIEIQMTLDFKEAIFGTQKEIELEKNVICPKCQGNGAEPGTKIGTCKTCNGSGQITRVQSTILGSIQTSSICPDCEGQGKVPTQKCRQCNGQGTTRNRVKIKFKIPAGIDNGQSIRLAGKGEEVSGAGQAGDLYITFRVREDKKFTREGSDIITQENISFSQAALGDKIEVETVDGPIILKIPAGTQSGKTFKLTNRGVPNPRTGTRGNHLIEVILKTPTKLSKKEKDLFEELKNSESKKGWKFF